MTRAELWTRLAEEGLVSGEVPAAEAAGAPWPVRTMMGVAGWLGALFLLGFLGALISGIFRDAEMGSVLGLLCCGAAYAMYSSMPRNDFAGQFALAVSMAGQALVFTAMTKMGRGGEHASVLLLFAAFQALLAVIVPNYLHRVLATVGACVCLYLGLGGLGAPPLAIALAAALATIPWLYPATMAARMALWEPMAYGAAIAFLPMDAGLVMGRGFWREIHGADVAGALFLPWVGAVATGAILLFAAWRLGARGAALTGAVVVAACGLRMPGLTAAILVLVTGFASGRRPLMGLGLAAFAAYLGYFYYSLEVTLLVKSGVLCGSGVCLLAMRWWMGEGRNA